MANSLPQGFLLDAPVVATDEPTTIAEQVMAEPGVVDTQAAPEVAASPELPEGFEVDEPAVVDADTPWLEVLAEGAKNAPNSARAFGTDLKKAFMNPRQTVEGLSSMVFGIIEKGLPEQEGEDAAKREQAADLIISHYRNRFGTVEGFKRAVAKDPVGVLADVATVVLPAGKVVQGAGTVTKLKALSTLGSATAKAGAAIDPIQALGQATRVFRLIPKALPASTLRKALKFTTTLPEKTKQAMTRLALDKQISPTVEGLEKLRGQINSLGNDITVLVDSATEGGTRIKTEALFKAFGQLEEQARLSGTPSKSINAIRRIRKDITAANRKTLTPTEAQTLKQNIYRELESAYTKTTARPAAVNAQKAVAKAAKELLEGVVPQLRSLNKAQGVRLALARELDRITGRMTNNNFIPLTAAAAAPASIPAAVGLGIIGQNKAKIALILERLRTIDPTINLEQAFTSLGLQEAVRATDEEGNQ